MFVGFQKKKKVSSTNTFNLDQSKISGSSVKELTEDEIDIILDQCKLKAFANDIIDLTRKLKFDLEWVENSVEIGENAGYQHSLLLPQCFRKLSSRGR